MPSHHQISKQMLERDNVVCWKTKRKIKNDLTNSTQVLSIAV